MITLPKDNVPLQGSKQGLYLETLHLKHTRNTSAGFNLVFLIDRLSEMGGAELALARLANGLPNHDIRPLVVTFSENICEELRTRFTCPILVFPLRRTYGRSALRVAWQIRAFLIAHDIRLVHTFFETSDLFGGLIVRSIPNVALVSSRRDMGILRRRKHRIAYPVLSHLAHRVVTVSERVRQWCIQADRLDSGRVVTVYNGVDVAPHPSTAYLDFVRSNVRDQLAIPYTQTVITAIGHIRHVKGYDILVDAAALVQRQHPDVLFLIAGGEHEVGRRAELLERIQAHKIEASVRLLGEMDQTTTLLHSTDIFLLPSRSEGFSNSLIEAMASGLPCVATDVGGNAEAISDGLSGLVVPSEDPQAMANALTRLLASADLRRSMGEQSRHIVERRFTQAAMVQNMVALYREALAALDA
ncbi:MAG: glycosyltransferase [Acidobacteria bacterium]|nr:glycosyltransferase [Acidobacteriota bacterium]